MVIYNNHYTGEVSSKNIYSPLTPETTDIRARQTNWEAIAVLSLLS